MLLQINGMLGRVFNSRYTAPVCNVEFTAFLYRELMKSGVEIKCAPVRAVYLGSSCSSSSRTKRFRFFSRRSSITDVLATLCPTKGKNAVSFSLSPSPSLSSSFFFSPLRRLNLPLYRVCSLRRKWWSLTIKFMSRADSQEWARERLA